MQRTIDIKLLEPASYGRLPMWEACDHFWPSIDPVRFRANDEGNGNLIKIASRLLDQSESECSVD